VGKIVAGREGRVMSFRIGQGYDVHPLVEGRRLILGGEEIPFDLGLDGFSDADVVLHALGDALLGAIGQGDIGSHFPPGEARWQDADSAELLRMVLEKVRERGYTIVNCDITVIAEAPKLAPYRDQIRQRISRILDIPTADVSLKATTHERLGTLGRGEGIAALAVVLLESS
jgi:2-C-methyl-D-erythritol 2,4-cyclodiphosphate synthase